jgi:hypothetical protein
VQQRAERHAQHHEGQDSPERDVRHTESRPGAEPGAHDRWNADGERPSNRQHLVTMKAERRAHVLSEHADPVRTVGDAGWKAQKDQQRERQKRTSARKDVDDGGNETDEKKGNEPEPGHGVSLFNLTRGLTSNF